MSSRETRSQAKMRNFLESLHPQCVEAFKEGLGSVLRQWTALELAVYHQVCLMFYFAFNLSI